MRKAPAVLRQACLAAETNQLALDMRERFADAGFQVIDDPVATDARADAATVISAVRVDHGGQPVRVGATPAPKAAAVDRDDLDSWLIAASALALLAADFVVRRREGRRSSAADSPAVWLQVWDARLMTPTGLELFVRSDDNATQQLDVLAEVTDYPRGDITVRPTTGWNGYGFPN